MITVLSIVIFIIGFFFISAESVTRISKTAVSLLVGVCLWFFVSAVGQGEILSGLEKTALEIFELVIFLLSSMTLVEILAHYGFFDFLSQSLLKLHIRDKGQFFIITGMTFMFSSFLNNLTTVIVMIEIAQKFFKGKNLLKAGAAIIICANAGGVFSPIGDVTTTMLWLAGKFSAREIMAQTFIPALAVYAVTGLLIGRSITDDSSDTPDTPYLMRRSEKIIISLCLASFFMPLVMTFFHLPPYFGLLLGTATVWIAADLLRQRRHSSTKLTISIEKFFQKTDIGSLYFFVGILFAIGALSQLGVLKNLSLLLFGTSPNGIRIITGSILIGLLSALLDNVPLTAAAIDIVSTTNAAYWSLLSFTVGVGGSILLIGSAPGIIAMSIIRELSFIRYIRIATVPALLAYVAGIIVWLGQNYILNILFRQNVL